MNVQHLPSSTELCYYHDKGRPVLDQDALSSLDINDRLDNVLSSLKFREFVSQSTGIRVFASTADRGDHHNSTASFTLITARNKSEAMEAAAIQSCQDYWHFPGRRSRLLIKGEPRS